MLFGTSVTSGESGCPESTACVEPTDLVVLVEPPLGVSGLVPIQCQRNVRHVKDIKLKAARFVEKLISPYSVSNNNIFTVCVS